jgi:hypothetical protein
MFKTLQEHRQSAGAEDGKKHAKRQGEQSGCSRRSKNIGDRRVRRMRKTCEAAGGIGGIFKTLQEHRGSAGTEDAKNMRSGRGDRWDIQDAPRT